MSVFAIVKSRPRITNSFVVFLRNLREKKRYFFSFIYLIPGSVSPPDTHRHQFPYRFIKLPLYSYKSFLLVLSRMLMSKALSKTPIIFPSFFYFFSFIYRLRSNFLCFGSSRPDDVMLSKLVRATRSRRVSLARYNARCSPNVFLFIFFLSFSLCPYRA